MIVEVFIIIIVIVIIIIIIIMIVIIAIVIIISFQVSAAFSMHHRIGSYFIYLTNWIPIYGDV